MISRAEIEKLASEIKAERHSKTDELYKDLASEIDKKIKAEQERRRKPFRSLTRNTDQ